MKLDDYTIHIRVAVHMTLWEAIKFRIAGLSSLNNFIEKSLQKKEQDNAE
jgi:hypothetical protein